MSAIEVPPGVDPKAPLLERLNAVMGTLRKSERKVAELVAQNPSFVVGSTMAGVAEAAGVSEPTVMRFCTSLGFGGFQQFKISLAQTLALGMPATLSTISREDSTSVLATKIFDHTLSSLDRAKRFLDLEQLDRAVDAILGCTSMDLAGLGASAIITQDAEQKAPLFGIPCSAPSDPHQQYMAACMTGPGRVTVVVSNTGRTQSLLEVARTAKANGATVVAISGERSPLLEYADIPLIVRTIEDTDIFTPTVSRLAGLVVIDVLATAVALRRGPRHNDKLTTMKEGLTRFRRHEGTDTE